MSIRSTTEPEYNLFTAVDDMSYSNKVVFAFRKSFEAEAAASIPGLPLILQGYYSHKVWTWFTEEAKDETEAYEWDPNLGLIEKQTAIDIDDDYITLAGWEDLDDDDQPVTSSAPTTTVHGFALTNKLGKNQYQDDGTIKTKQLVPESDEATQASTTTNTTSPANLQSLLAILDDPDTAAQVRAILDQQNPNPNPNPNPGATSEEPVAISPMKPTETSTTPGHAMDIDQE